MSLPGGESCFSGQEDILADYSFIGLSLGLYYYSDLQLWLELYFGRESGWELGGGGSNPI
jgi:hypothetical protein